MLGRSLPIIVTVLLLPVVVATFFAARSLTFETEALNSRHDQLYLQRIDEATELLRTQLNGEGDSVLAQVRAAFGQGGAEALSGLVRRAHLMYAAIFRDQSQVVSTTSLEHQYHYVRLLQDKTLELAQALGDRNATIAEFVPLVGGYAFVRCARGESGDVICVALDSAYLTKALRSVLQTIERRTGLTNPGLVGPNGVKIQSDETKGHGSQSHALNKQFSGWSLHTDEPIRVDGYLSVVVVFYAIAGGLIAGWVALCLILHRLALQKEKASIARANVMVQFAHDFWTPLANLKLYTELLKRGASDAAAVLHYGDIFDDEIARLTDVAENAIAVSRGEMAKPRLERAVPDDCVQAILTRFEPTLAAAQCSVRFVSGAPDDIVFDKAAWERCVINLIDNARKYAPRSEIEIATRRDGNFLRLDIKDNGQGVPVTLQCKIFHLKLSGAECGKSGFGLGLAAVRALARQNGGDCWVDRETEHKQCGAHFALTMKVQPVGDMGGI